MTEIAKEKIGYEERLAETSRKLTLVITILTSLGMAIIAAIVLGDHYNRVSYWFWIALVLIAGAVVGYVECWLLKHILRWLIPTKPDAEKARFSLFSIILVAQIITCLNWRHVPTEAQIDAIHNDPPFAAAIAEMNAKQIDPDLLMEAMKNEHAHVNRYVIFGVEALVSFIGVCVLFGAYWTIFRILCRLFGPKTATNNSR